MAGRTEKAVRAELRKLGGTATSDSLYAIAVDLAAAIDLTESARDIATLSSALRAAIAEMRALHATTPGEASASDVLKARRSARIARLAAGAAS